MTSKDDLRKKLDSKEERQKLLNEVNGLTYFGPVGELIENLEKKGDVQSVKQVNELASKAAELRQLLNLALEKIEQGSRQ